MSPKDILFFQYPRRLWRERLAGVYRYADKAGWRVHVVEYGRTALAVPKAIRYCRQQGWKDLAIVGAAGKREDHLLSNVFRAMVHGVELVTDYGRFLPFKGKLRLKVKKHTSISVFAPDPATRMTSKGLVWPLNRVEFANLYCATLNRAAATLVELSSNRPAFVFIEGE